MSNSALPLILLVPGTFGTPDGRGKLIPFLEQSGFTTHPGPYPSCDPSDPSTATSEKDIASLCENVILRLLEQRDLIIIAHSYGGVVAGAAAKGLDKTTRKAENKTTAVVGLIYVAGNITLEGEPLLEAVGGKYPPFIKVDTVSIPCGSKIWSYANQWLDHLGNTKADYRPNHAAFERPCSDRAGQGCTIQRLRSINDAGTRSFHAPSCASSLRDQTLSTCLG